MNGAAHASNYGFFLNVSVCSETSHVGYTRITLEVFNLKTQEVQTKPLPFLQEAKQSSDAQSSYLYRDFVWETGNGGMLRCNQRCLLRL